MLRLHTFAFPTIVIFGLLQSFTEGISISLFIPLLRGLIGRTQAPAGDHWLVGAMESVIQRAPPERRLAFIALCLLCAVLASALLAYLHGVLLASVDGKIAHHLRRRIFSQLLAVPFAFIEQDRSGRLLNILASDSWRASDALKILVHMTITSCTIAVYVILLFLMSWQLTLIVAGTMLLVSGIVRLLTRGVRELGQRVTRLNSELADRMIEGIDAMRIIRAFGRERYEQGRFDTASERMRTAMLRLGLLEEAVHPVHEILVSALFLIILIVIARNASDVSVMLVFVFVLYRLQPRVKDLEASRVRLASLATSVDEVFSLLNGRCEPQHVGTASPARAVHDDEIVFDHVSFRYDRRDRPALSDVSFRIPAGLTTAFVGPSGGGKSTIIKLILRFNEPTEGRILADGRSLHEIDLDSWRSQIGLVSQDGYLFNATVRENIAYGRLDASLDEIVDAARRADAHAFIEQLPHGYETVLGHRGVRLSGGQQQRISVARAIVRNPRILILDEATNALYSISEQWIQETLNTLRDNRTIIMIAHRLATIEQADQIMVLEKGRIRECGTLRELVTAGGLFTNLYQLQHRPSSVSVS
jgi:ABC-type multidrug transport system fused ATPase/permease subunit